MGNVAFFYLLVVIPGSLVPPGMEGAANCPNRIIQTLGDLGYMITIPETKTLSSRTTSFTVYINSVNGLCNSIYFLLHLSILSSDIVQGIVRNFLYIYLKNNGKADTDHKSDVIFIRLQNKVKYVRELAL